MVKPGGEGGYFRALLGRQGLILSTQFRGWDGGGSLLRYAGDTAMIRSGLEGGGGASQGSVEIPCGQKDPN